MAETPSMTTAESHRLCQSLLSQLELFQQAVTQKNRHSAGINVELSGTRVGQVLDELDRSLSHYLNQGSLRNRDKKIDIELTEAGEIVHEFTKDVLERLHSMVGQLHRLQHETELKVATINTVLLKYGDELKARFKQALPESTLTIHTFGKDHYPEKILAEIVEGRADIGITSYPPKIAPPLALTRMPEHPMVLIFPTKYRHLPKENEVNLLNVVRHDPKLKIVIFQRSFDVPVTNRVLAYVRVCQSDLGPSQRIEVDNLSQAKDLLLNLPGTIGILPELAVRNEVAKGLLKTYRLNPPMKPWTWGIIHREESSRPAVRHFLDCLIHISRQ